jgi:hypothetical protein
MNALSRKPFINFQATVSFLSVYNFQCPYPRKSCFVITWFPGTCLPSRFLETANMSQYLPGWECCRSKVIHFILTHFDAIKERWANVPGCCAMGNLCLFTGRVWFRFEALLYILWRGCTKRWMNKRMAVSWLHKIVTSMVFEGRDSGWVRGVQIIYMRVEVGNSVSSIGQ